jgi:hypothetical protein
LHGDIMPGDWNRRSARDHQVRALEIAQEGRPHRAVVFDRPFWRLIDCAASSDASAASISSVWGFRG